MIKYVELPGKDLGDIKLYSLSTCGWCRKTKEIFRDNGIKFSFVDVDTLNGEEREKAKETLRYFNPSVSFPTVVINGSEVIKGFDEAKLRKFINSKD